MPAIDLIHLAAYAVPALITPGPNNMMVAISGVNFGFMRTRAHVLGICGGFSAMTFLVGVGLGSAFQKNPALHVAMRYAAFVFLCWIAWRIAFANISNENGKRRRPLTFIEAVLFQWINPKSWAVAAGAAATFITPEGNVYEESALVAGVFLLFQLPCVFLWALFGAGIGGFLRNHPLTLRCFNVVMAITLLAAMVSILFL